MRRFRWISLLGSFLTVASFAGANEVRVAAAHVNLRAAPNATSEVVGQVSKGDVLTVQRAEGDWLAVDPPPTVDLWVYSELVRDGVASASKVLVRSGPGINYRDVGRIEQGAKVTAKGASASGEWVKISAPPGCVLWISRKYTESPSEPPRRDAVAAKSNEKPREAPATTGATAKRAATPEAPRAEVSAINPDVMAGHKLAARQPQGIKTEYDGVLGESGLAWKRPSKYRVVRTDAKGHVVSACYVIGNSKQLSSLIGKNMLVYGPEYHVEGALYPVLVVEQIVLRD